MLAYSLLLFLFFRNSAWKRTFRQSFKKIHRQLLFLRNHLKVLFWRVCLRAKCDIYDRRFRISSAALLTQVKLCFAGTGREILNSNPAERLDEHPFILGLSAVFPFHWFRVWGAWIGICKVADPCLFFREIRRSARIFVEIRNHNHFRKQKCKGLKVNWYMWMPVLISRK